MTGEPNPEQPYASTTWRRKVVRIPAPPQGQQRVARRASSCPEAADRAPGWYRFRPYDLKRKRAGVQITVVYRGGPECWYEVRARGAKKRFPGVFALHDVMRQIYND